MITPTMNSSDPHSWYAVRVRGGWEKSAGQVLECKRLEPFVPLYRVRHRWCDRWKWVEMPLFPGYLFCRFSQEDRLSVLTTPGVIQIAGNGKNPIPVEGREIESIRAILRSQLPAVPWPFCRLGDRVRVTGGPLRGLEGLLLDFGGEKRLIVSVSLLQRSVSVEIDEALVVPEDVRPRVEGPPAVAPDELNHSWKVKCAAHSR
jgi:transcription termination/antitermination protein NusG